MFIADNITPYIDPVFGNPDIYNKHTLYTALIGYSVQIWADFSGYTDMGRGTARMLGIHLPENFLSPYFSKSPSEFWQRWHLTLSRWIRDYIYIPLGGNRGSKLKTAWVVIVTMFISGLWHGANWTFVAWGIYHGILLVMERFLSKLSIASRVNDISKNILIYFAVLFGWLIFRVQDFKTLVIYFNGLFHTSGRAEGTVSPVYVFTSIVFCFFIQWIGYKDLKTNIYPRLEWLKQKMSIYQKFELSDELLGYASGVLLAALFILSLFFQYSAISKPFIYFQF